MELADLLDGTTGDMSVALIQGLIVGIIVGVVADNISSRIKWFFNELWCSKNYGCY